MVNLKVVSANQIIWREDFDECSCLRKVRQKEKEQGGAELLQNPTGNSKVKCFCQEWWGFRRASHSESVQELSDSNFVESRRGSLGAP